MPMGNERSGIPVGERITGRLASARRHGRNGAFDSAAQDPAHPIPGAQSLLDDNASRCAPPPGARERTPIVGRRLGRGRELEDRTQHAPGGDQRLVAATGRAGFGSADRVRLLRPFPTTTLFHPLL